MRTALASAEVVFRRWFGPAYVIDVLRASLATAAVGKLDGDPVWLLVIAGAGGAKTETVSALAGAGGKIISTIASEGALLSATASKDRPETATGGLLREIGNRGLIVIKDFTSIISADRNVRPQVMAALREIYDGFWSRIVGSDGGQTLSWEGRIVLVGACTTEWDTAYSVVAAMGDRFLTIRPGSSSGRMDVGRQALRNVGREEQMRTELRSAVHAVIKDIKPPPSITSAYQDRVLRAAELVTLARTSVVYDYRGNVTDVHDPEAPTRFAKQLLQLMRGGIAIGLDQISALNLAMRCARDSMPPLRLAILRTLYERGISHASEISRLLNKPRTSVRRHLEALKYLSLICETSAKPHVLYELDPRIDLGVLDAEQIAAVANYVRSGTYP